jgi:hypothetical protein
MLLVAAVHDAADFTDDVLREGRNVSVAAVLGDLLVQLELELGYLAGLSHVLAVKTTLGRDAFMLLLGSFNRS